MIFLRQLGWIDYEALAATLAARQRRSLLKGENGVRSVTIRETTPAGSLWEHPDLAGWSAMKNMIGRAGRILAEQWPQLEIDAAYVDMLEASAVMPWTIDRVNGPRLSVHVALVGNPMCLLLAGNEGLNVLPGMVVAHGLDVWHSAINAGSSPRLHLILKLKRREIEE